MATNAERYAQQVLKKMVQDAHDDTWEGSLTKLVENVAPLAYYSPIRSVLVRSGAIVQLKRGGGSSKSIWRIMRPDAKLEGIPTTAIDVEEKLDLEKRVANLEALVGNVNIGQALVDHLREGHG